MRGTCDRACQASQPDRLYSHRLQSIWSYFTLAFLCTQVSNHPNAFHSLLPVCQVVNSQRWWFIRRLPNVKNSRRKFGMAIGVKCFVGNLPELVQDKSFYAGDFFFSPSLVYFSAIKVVVWLWNHTPNQPVLSMRVFPWIFVWGSFPHPRGL